MAQSGSGTGLKGSLRKDLCEGVAPGLSGRGAVHVHVRAGDQGAPGRRQPGTHPRESEWEFSCACSAQPAGLWVVKRPLDIL